MLPHDNIRTASAPTESAPAESDPSERWSSPRSARSVCGFLTMRANMHSMPCLDEVAAKTRCDPNRVLVLSLRPRYAEAILSGAKTVELRRTRPNIKIPTLALIYATNPVRSLVGSCCVDSVESWPLRELWCLASEQAGVSRREFHEYFAGLSEGVALQLSGAQRAEVPVSLARLRRLVGGFRPPQSFAYLPAADGGRILAVAAPAVRFPSTEVARGELLRLA